MATFTTNYNLQKDDPTDYYNIANINSNLDLIDAAVAGKVNAESPAFTGTPTAPTATTGTDTTQLATTEFVQQELDAQVHDAGDITTGTIPIARGGTGADNAATALSNLGLTATATELNIMDGVTATTTELNYIDGVTSSIQTQLNAKAALASPTFTGTPKATANTSYTTSQIRNAKFSTTVPTSLDNGEICFVYE